MGAFFKCPVCGNEDPKYIGYKSGKAYCRRCILFKPDTLVFHTSYPKNAPILIDYDLSKEQKELSYKLLNNYKKGINSLVNAVCGSGKTEIVLQIISYAIKCGDRVAFAVPRRDVAIELHQRLKSIFKYNKVIAVYGGHHDIIEGDLVVATTHQLYRYEQYFNLIILDEIDAFPFANNEVLNAMFFRAIKGSYVMLSATPSNETINFFSNPGFEILNLNKRFHNFPLPVPEIVLANSMTIYLKLLRFLAIFLKETKQVFIFCPTIEICEVVYLFLKVKYKNGNFVHSKRAERTKIIDDFRNKKYQFLVTTAVLERGVTVKDLQVIIFNADHALYTKAALIQISGRAGRKKDAPEGNVIYLAKKITKSIQESIETIKHSNSDL